MPPPHHTHEDRHLHIILWLLKFWIKGLEKYTFSVSWSYFTFFSSHLEGLFLEYVFFLLLVFWANFSATLLVLCEFNCFLVINIIIIKRLLLLFLHIFFLYSHLPCINRFTTILITTIVFYFYRLTGLSDFADICVSFELIIWAIWIHGKVSKSIDSKGFFVSFHKLCEVSFFECV